MKLRVTQRPDEVFEAEITADYPANIPGPISFLRKDTGEFITLGDCLGLPGTPFKKYDILEVSADERARFDAAGFMIEEVAPTRQEDMRKIALPVQHIDFLSSGLNAIALIWVDLADRPDLVQMAQAHLGVKGIAECSWYAPDITLYDASIYLHLQAREPTQSAFILGFKMATYYTQLVRIATERFLWILGGPRPDYLIEEHADDPSDLAERLTAARGEGITLGLHPTLAFQLEKLLLTWQEAQSRQN